MSLVASMLNLRQQGQMADLRRMPDVVLLFDNFQDQMRFRHQLFRELGASRIELQDNNGVERLKVAGINVTMGTKR